MMHLYRKNRVIITSDIHGDLIILKELLNKINFTKNDTLIILGDVIEKGTENLLILDYLLQLKEHNDVFILQGNCDRILLKLKHLTKEMFYYFALDKGNSIINEMAKILNIELDRNDDHLEIALKFEKHFKKYYDFVESFNDYIILNDKYYLSHKGNSEEILNKQNIKENNYINISGHKPAVLYCSKLPSFNPYHFNKNNILIDGALNVCPFGQLNYLILENNIINECYITHFKKYKAINDYIYNNDDIITTNSFIDKLKLIDFNGDFYKFMLNDNIVYSHKSQYYNNICYFATNYFVSLKKDKIYEICLITNSFVIIKDNGITGLIDKVVFDNELCSL